MLNIPVVVLWVDCDIFLSKKKKKTMKKISFYNNWDY